MSRLEDMIQRPRESLVALCSFLEIDFKEEMLEMDVKKNSSFNERRWKSGGADKEAMTTWKSVGMNTEMRIIGLLCGRSMRQFGY